MKNLFKSCSRITLQLSLIWVTLVSFSSTTSAQIIQDNGQLQVTASFISSNPRPGDQNTFLWEATPTSGNFVAPGNCYFSGLPGLNDPMELVGSFGFITAQDLTVSVFCVDSIGRSGRTTVRLDVNEFALTVAGSFSPSSIVVGQSSTFSWSSTSATFCSSAGILSITGTQGSATYTASSPGLFSVNVTCTGSDGQTASGQFFLSVQPITPPTASLSLLVERPETVPPFVNPDLFDLTISWSSTNSSSCDVTPDANLRSMGIPRITNGSTSDVFFAGQIVNRPPYPALFVTLTCSGAGGSVSVTRQVVFPPVLILNPPLGFTSTTEGFNGVSSLEPEVGLDVNVQNITSSHVLDLNADGLSDQLIYLPEMQAAVVMISQYGSDQVVSKFINDVSDLKSIEQVQVDAIGQVSVSVTR